MTNYKVGPTHWGRISSGHTIVHDYQLTTIGAALCALGYSFNSVDAGELADAINSNSLEVLADCRLEPALADTPAGETVQFERLGYFCPDPDTTPDHPVFNRTLPLRDSWARLQAKGKGNG